MTDPDPDPHAPPPGEFPADARDSPGPAGEPAPDEPNDGEIPAETQEVEAAAVDPLAEAQLQRDEYLDALRRKQAEFENFRKRMMRDGTAQRVAGHAEIAQRMLDVLDDFDRTLQAAGDTDPRLLKGVHLVHDKLTGVLADFGLRAIATPGEPFDPNRHEAVQQVDGDQPREDPVVAEVLRPGYELGERVLRAAMVVVEQ